MQAAVAAIQGDLEQAQVYVTQFSGYSWPGHVHTGFYSPTQLLVICACALNEFYVIDFNQDVMLAMDLVTFPNTQDNILAI